MPPLRPLLRQPALRLYLLGQACIVLGAGWMELTGSMVPMALGASAAIMLTVPLVRRLRGRTALRSGPPRG